MGNGLFRKKSLDRLSSPEQLDKMIIVTSPMTWLAIIAGGLIILVLLLWGIFGRIPITEEGKGILLMESVPTSVYARTTGVVTDTYVSSGDHVNKGDILYKIGSTEIVETINKLEKSIKDVNSVTFDSNNDVVTTENKVLVDIKGNKSELSLQTDLSSKSLDALKSEYERAVEETSRLKSEVDRASEDYYNSISSDNSKVIEYEFNNAASEYENAKVKYNEALSAYNKSPEDENLKAEKEEAYNNLKSKEDSYISKKTEYESYMNSISENNSESIKKQNIYNAALSSYTAAKSNEESLRLKVKSMEAELSGTKESQNVKEETLKEKFNVAKDALISELQTELEKYKKLEGGQEIIAGVPGVIYSTFVTTGTAVSIDTEMARIIQEDDKDDNKLQAVYFMPLAKGKNLQPGMKVNIYPGNLPKEEYGHMTGRVRVVAEYVTSYADLYTRFGDEQLASSFVSDGAVLQVICDIDSDSSSKSGYAWSTVKGKNVNVAAGTPLEGTMIVREVPPITMLLPKLKEKLEIE